MAHEASTHGRTPEETHVKEDDAREGLKGKDGGIRG